MARTRCAICSGRGRVWLAPFFSVQCLDCKGRGSVDHCVACAGQKRVWMGGDEYLDPCPACDGTGVHRSPVVYVAQRGVTTRAPSPVVGVQRNIAAELRA